LTPAARLATAGKYATLVVGSTIALLPLVVVFLTSLKTSREVAVSGPLSLPHHWFNLHNYVVAFDDATTGTC
jgi:multiple sugar transport system permease protein